MSAEGRKLLEARLVRKLLPSASAVIHKGDRVSGAYFVLSGRLRVFTHTPTGKQATLYLIEPGETCVLALNSLFGDLRYPAWVEAECQTEVGILPGAVYRTLFAREPAVQNITVKALSTAMFRLMTELEQTHAQRLDQRLAGYLVMRASTEGHVRKTQQEIAAHIGTTREVVARLLGQFAKQGLVATRRGQVTLLNVKALAELSAPITDI